MEKLPRPARIAGGLLVAALGGAFCAWIGTPVPWMIGSTFAMAFAQIAGARFVALPQGRDAGLVVVGIALGLYFTAPVLKEVATFWPWFIALGFCAHGFGMASAWVLWKLSGIDRTTAYFASMPAGASEMSHMAEVYGGQADKAAFAHSLRIMAVVVLFPIGMAISGFGASEAYRPVATPFSLPGLFALLATGAAAGYAAKRFNAPTAFMLGPLLATIALTANGVSFSSMPSPLVNVAQVAMGCMMGSRFDRDFLASAPRFAGSVLVSVAVTLALAIVVGVLLAKGSGTELGNGLLAAAPGGIAEMSITAKVLKLGVAFITAAHLVRFLVVVFVTVPIFRWMRRTGHG